jgi:Zn-dependent protease with chaperone function
MAKNVPTKTAGGGVSKSFGDHRMDGGEGTATCPACGGPVPIEQGLRNWCEKCNWNVGGEPTLQGEGIFLRQYVKLGDRYGRAVLERLKAAGLQTLKPRWTVQKCCGVLLALCVHLLSLAVLVVGLLLIAGGFPEWLPMTVGAIACAFACLIMPRPMRRPTKDALPRDEFPALYSLVDDIARELGGKAVRHIVVNEDFNAYYAEVGWARSPVLGIGLPLWLTLAPQERIAVLGHEIAHGVNRDSTRGFLIGSALNALDAWLAALQSSGHARPSLIGLAIRHMLSLPFLAWQSVTAQLLWLDKQTAEYYADHLGARISGTEAAVSTLHRLGCDEHLNDVLLRSAYSTSQSGEHVLGLYLQRISNLPEREWKRLERATQIGSARLDASHPPTAYRVALLQSYPTPPRLIATESVMSAVDAEIDTLRKKIGDRLIARYARD